MTDERRWPQPQAEKEERAQKGVDARPVVKVKPSDMPRPSGLAPQQPAPTSERPPPPKE
jgi:hypothetical protein